MTEEELDKLAEKYQDDNTIIRYYGPGNGSVPEYNKTMAEVFKDGWNACREQMISEAAEGEVKDFRFVREINYSSAKIEFNSIPELKEGDKVRIIIVKKD